MFNEKDFEGNTSSQEIPEQEDTAVESASDADESTQSAGELIEDVAEDTVEVTEVTEDTKTTDTTEATEETEQPKADETTEEDVKAGLIASAQKLIAEGKSRVTPAWNKVKEVCFSTKQKKRSSIIAASLVVLALAAIIINENFGDSKPDGPIEVHPAVLSDFEETGFIKLFGLEKFSEKEVLEHLSFEPKTDFTVKKDKDGKMLVTLQNPRNIAYVGTFEMPMKNSDEKYSAVFDVNDPGLYVRIGGGGSSLNKHDSLKLVFSEQVDIYSLEKNMTIEPRTSYTMSYDLNEVTLTPETGWIVTNNYQIKIKSAYASKTGKEFAENQVMSFKVKAPNTPQPTVHTPTVDFYSADNFLLTEDKDMTIGFTADYLRANVPLLVETYRMDSLEKYREQAHIYLDYDVNLDSLEKLDTNAFLIENGDNKFEVPNFGEGAYIISAKYKDPVTKEDKKVCTSYQVTPISVYMQSNARETLVWLNTSKDSSPLAGYKVVFDGKEENSGVTDANGLLTMPNDKLGMNPDELEYRYETPFSINDPDGKLVYYDDPSLRMDTYHSERYYSYLFLDRTLYKPEDTICFWGFAKPFRYNKNEMPKTATVRFDAEGLDIKVEAAINENGVFSGEIPLERIKSTQYSIQAELFFPSEKPGEEGTRHVMETQYVSVKEFEKPTFVLSADCDKDYYGPEDTVKVTASASFYDGTPLPFYPIEVSYMNTRTGSWVNLPDTKTDASGNISFSFPAAQGESTLYDTHYLNSNQYKVQIANDGEQVTRVGGYRYFPSTVILDTRIEKQNDENLQLLARTYKLNIDSPALAAYIKSVGGDVWLIGREELLRMARGEPVDVDLELSLRWSYVDMLKIRHNNNQRSQNGYVKFANSYSLDEAPKERVIETIDDWETEEKQIIVKTQNGSALIKDLIFKPEGAVIDFREDLYLSAEINYEDTKKSYCYDSAYYPVYRSNYWDYRDEEEERVVEGYSYKITEMAENKDITPSADYYRSVAMNADSGAKFELLLDGKPVEANAKGKILYTVIQDGILEQDLISGNTFDLRYKMTYGRTVRLASAYFDGEKTHYVKQLDLNANDESLKVNLEVTPDKDGYRPGESVSLNVKATDYLGRGAAGNICVAVVDESLFALSEQRIDVLYGVYEDLYGLYNEVREYSTAYRGEPVQGNMWDGGKGGEGGVEFYDSYRSNFKDTALFLPATTDASGNSHIEFKLPDNTTSWRITAIAVGSDMRAGESKSNIISTLPFFVKPVMTSKYIDGDDIAMLVQGHGTLIDETSAINYTVTITGDGVNKTLTGGGKAYQALEFNFGKLPTGSYKVVSKAQFLGYSDTVELPLNVLKSNLELVIHKNVDVKQKLNIDAMRYPVTLTFYDKQNEAFLTSINSLFGHYCMQANQRLSRFVAKRVISQTIEGGSMPYYIADGNERASDMQNDDGGIGYYPGEPSEPLLTTYVLMIAKDQFNLKSMTQYYRDELTAPIGEKTRAACYLGLAVIGDAKPQELLDIIEKETLSRDALAYYIAGLAYLDETETATKLYNEKLASIAGQINNGAAKDLSWERDAAAAWVAASRLHHPDADSYSIYFGKASWRYRTLFECMIYVTNYNRRVTTTSFNYTIKGVTQRANLGYSGMKTLNLSKSDLESLSFSEVPDSLMATAYYVGEPEEIGIEQSKNMSISKAIKAVDDNTYEVSLTVSLGKDAPMGRYDISDWVPSNTRLYSFNRTSKCWYTSEGQKLYIFFDNNIENQEQERVITYRVRQTFNSESALDTAYMIHGDSGENCNTEKGVFTPKTSPDAVVIKAAN